MNRHEQFSIHTSRMESKLTFIITFLINWVQIGSYHAMHDVCLSIFTPSFFDIEYFYKFHFKKNGQLGDRRWNNYNYSQFWTKLQHRQIVWRLWFRHVHWSAWIFRSWRMQLSKQTLIDCWKKSKSRKFFQNYRNWLQFKEFRPFVETLISPINSFLKFVII